MATTNAEKYTAAIFHTDTWKKRYNALNDCEDFDLTPEQFNQIYALFMDGSHGYVHGSRFAVTDGEAASIDMFVDYLAELDAPVSLTDALIAVASKSARNHYNRKNDWSNNCTPNNCMRYRNRLDRIINALIDTHTIPVNRIEIKTCARTFIRLYQFSQED